MWVTDIEPLPVPGGLKDAALHFTRFYSSDMDASRIPGVLPLGYNWTHNYNIKLAESRTAPNPRHVYVYTEQGTEVVFYGGDGGVFDNMTDGDSKLYLTGANFVWETANGTRSTFDNANSNRLMTIVDVFTNTLTLTYDASSFLTNVQDQFGRSLTFYNYSGGTIDYLSSSAGFGQFFYYDGSTNLTGLENSLLFGGGAQGGVYTYKPGTALLTSVLANSFSSDPPNIRHYYAYDAAGKVTSETNAVGAVMVFNRDDVTHSVVVTNRNGKTYTDAFNGASRHTSRVDFGGTATYQRDEKNRVTNLVNRLGYATQSFYASNSCGCQVAGGIIMSIDPLNRTNQWEVETNYNKPIAFTNALGNITRWKYDSRGNATNITDALQKDTFQNYDAAGNLTRIINANNATNSFGWDQFGNLTNRTDALGNVTRLKYDFFGRVTNSVDVLQRTNSVVRDGRGWVVKTVDPMGGSVNQTWDANGNLNGLQNQLGQTTSYGYDNVSRLTSVTLPAGGGVFTSYAYDGNGNRIAVTNALGNATRYGFDALDRMTTLTNALTKVWSFAYDAESRMTSSTDANSHSTTFAYDAANQLTSLTNALTQTIKFQYDLAGNRTNIVDGRGNALGFRYDAVNRLTNLVYAASDLEKFSYDAVGNLTNYITRAAQTNRYIYDAANRLTNITYNGASDVISFSYDAGNQLKSALWKNGSATNANDTFSYDLNGRLTNETQTAVGASPKAVGYEYDAAGRRTKLVYPDGTFITYQYNANGWLTNIANGGTNSIVAYTYDAAGRRTKRQLENSTFTVYDYDTADQVTGITHVKAASGVTNTLSQYNYGYDNAGNRTCVKRLSGKGEVFKYDNTDQLTNVLYDATNPDTTPSAATNEVRYVFDAAGNRTSVNSTNTGTTSYVPNALNQYTNVGGTTMKYDGNGNPTNVVENGVTLSLTYDRENRLITVNNGTVTVTNTYDAFKRLVERASTDRTRFIYDNQWRVIAEYNEGEALLRKYVYGPEIDEPVRLTQNGTSRYYHQAALGTVTEMTGSQGNVRERYFYDVYGAVTITDQNTNTVSGAGWGNRLLFQGRDRDPATGLYNFRNRYYSPTLGRFLQVDPIRLSKNWPNRDSIETEGGADLYQFVLNDPMGKTDALGLVCGAGLTDYLVPDKPFGYDFSECCERHDICYGAYGANRLACDQDFGDCTQDVCESSGGGGCCQSLAGTYYAFLRLFGWMFFHPSPFDPALENLPPGGIPGYELPD